MLTSILFLLHNQVPISTNPPGHTPECTKLILKFRNFLGKASQSFLKESKFLQVFVAGFVSPPLTSGWLRPWL